MSLRSEGIERIQGRRPGGGGTPPPTPYEGWGWEGNETSNKRSLAENEDRSGECIFHGLRVGLGGRPSGSAGLWVGGGFMTSGFEFGIVQSVVSRRPFDIVKMQTRTSLRVCVLCGRRVKTRTPSGVDPTLPHPTLISGQVCVNRVLGPPSPLSVLLSYSHCLQAGSGRCATLWRLVVLSAFV